MPVIGFVLITGIFSIARSIETYFLQSQLFEDRSAFVFFFLCPALIHVMPVLALMAAKLIAGTAGDKDLHAMLAQPQRRLFVS